MKKQFIVCRLKYKEYKLLRRLAKQNTKQNNMSVRKYIKKLMVEYIN